MTTVDDENVRRTIQAFVCVGNVLADQTESFLAVTIESVAMTYSYDIAGVLREIHLNGEPVQFSYDAVGRVRAMYETCVLDRCRCRATGIRRRLPTQRTNSRKHGTSRCGMGVLSRAAQTGDCRRIPRRREDLDNCAWIGVVVFRFGSIQASVEFPADARSTFLSFATSYEFQ